MTWFKVDDGLHGSAKARRAGEAMALWVMAGSWCADQLTDGWVPEDMVQMLAPRTWRRWADKLVQVRLWIVEEREGECGWQFHDWDKYQPTKQQVLADREAAAERQRRARERAKESRRDKEDSERVSHGVTNGVSHGPPDHTRPDRSSYGTTHPPVVPPAAHLTPPGTDGRRGTRLPEEFAVTDAMKAWAREHAPLAGLPDHEMFMDHWRAQTGQRAVKRDWEATWRNWMRRVQENRERERNGRRTASTDIAKVTPLATADQRASDAFDIARRLGTSTA